MTTDAWLVTRANHIIQPTSKPTKRPNAARAGRYGPPVVRSGCRLRRSTARSRATAADQRGTQAGPTGRPAGDVRRQQEDRAADHLVDADRREVPLGRARDGATGRVSGASQCASAFVLRSRATSQISPGRAEELRYSDTAWERWTPFDSLERSALARPLGRAGCIMKSAMGTTSPRGRLRTTLPARAYTDAGVVRARDGARSSRGCGSPRAACDQLDHAGAFVRRDVAGASVLIVRADDGAIRAFHNVCRHRGTRLCTRSDGTFQGSIQCPYHAWTYGLDGRLLAAPQMDEVDGFDRADYPLRQVACETWDGHIFINLRSTRRSEPLAAQLGDLPARFAPWRDAGAAAGAPHRLRRRHQLEAGGPELQRVPALPGDPSAAQPDAPLPRRRERADRPRPIAAAPWASRRASRRSAPTASGGGRCCPDWASAIARS